MRSISKMWLSARRCALDLIEDRRGIAATEFAVIVPIMLVMFFGVVEFSSGVAVDRKVTLMARTLSDLTSQSTSVASSDMTNFFAASNAIMTPYSPAPTRSTISELYIDPNTLVARVQWSKGSSPRAVSSTVVVPSALAVAGTYLIYSEVSYLYTPAVGYVMSMSGVNLSDTSYTRPRQSTCVFFSPATACTTL
ncbi:MAG TPA: TadE/TadG family type IV pilus assembly protein [Bradyrhizobium sp.]|nr:TadE/TadG family type IV pilus assembly protein [Bradyrhizobium sp.]